MLTSHAQLQQSHLHLDGVDFEVQAAAATCLRPRGVRASVLATQAACVLVSGNIFSLQSLQKSGTVISCVPEHVIMQGCLLKG